jgi:hypothetical protein
VGWGTKLKICPSRFFRDILCVPGLVAEQWVSIPCKVETLILLEETLPLQDPWTLSPYQRETLLKASKHQLRALIELTKGLEMFHMSRLVELIDKSEDKLTISAARGEHLT